MTTLKDQYDADMMQYPAGTYKYIYAHNNHVFEIEVKLAGLTKTWNGYVTLPEGLEAHDPETLGVHGGITYTGTKDSHVVYGFDTAHMGDYTPLMPMPDLFGRMDYRSHAFVLSECERLCRQLC